MQYAGNFLSELLSSFKPSRLFGYSKKAPGIPEAQKREEEQPLKSAKQQKQQQQSKKHKQSRLKNQISQPEKQPQQQEEEEHRQAQQQKQAEQQKQQQQQRQQRQLQSRSRQSTLLTFSSEELPSLPWDQQESIKNTSIQSSRSVDVPSKRQSIQGRSSDTDESLRKYRRSREKPASLNLTQKIEREYIEVSDEKDHTPLTTPQECSRPSSSEFYSPQYKHSITRNDDSVVPRTPPREKRSSASFEVYSTEVRQTIYRSAAPQTTSDYSSPSDLTSSQFCSSRSSSSQSSLSQSSLSQLSSSRSSVVSTPSLELHSRNNTNENFDAFEHEGRSSLCSSASSASIEGANRGVRSRRYDTRVYSLYVPSSRENPYHDSFHEVGQLYDDDNCDDDDDDIPIGLSTPRQPPAQRRPLSDSLPGRAKMLASSRRSSDSVLLSGVNLPPARYEHKDVKRMSLHEYHKYQQEMVVVQLKKNQEKVSKRALANKKLSEMNPSRPMGPTLIQMQQEYKEQLTSMVGIQNKPVLKVHGVTDGIKSNANYKRHSAAEYGAIRRTLDGSGGMENRKRSNTVDGAMYFVTDVASKRKSYDALPSTSASNSYSKRLGGNLIDEMGDTRSKVTANTFVPPSSKYHPNSNLESQSLPSRHMPKQMHSIVEEQHHYPYSHGKSYSESVLQQKRAYPQQPERNFPMSSPAFQHSASSLSSSSTNHSSSSGSRTAARKSISSNAHSSGSSPLSAAHYGVGVQTEKKSRRKSALK